MTAPTQPSHRDVLALLAEAEDDNVDLCLALVAERRARAAAATAHAAAVTLWEHAVASTTRQLDAEIRLTQRLVSMLPADLDLRALRVEIDAELDAELDASAVGSLNDTTSSLSHR